MSGSDDVGGVEAGGRPLGKEMTKTGEIKQALRRAETFYAFKLGQ